MDRYIFPTYIYCGLLELASYMFLFVGGVIHRTKKESVYDVAGLKTDTLLHDISILLSIYP